MKKICQVAISLFLLGGFVSLDYAAAQRPEPKKTEIKGHTMYTLMEPGGIPAIFQPEFIPLKQADSLYHPDEPLIVVTDGTTTKGYSAWHLDEHEVVNDYLGKRAIAVTW